MAPGAQIHEERSRDEPRMGQPRWGGQGEVPGRCHQAVTRLSPAVPAAVSQQVLLWHKESPGGLLQLQRLLQGKGSSAPPLQNEKVPKSKERAALLLPCSMKRFPNPGWKQEMFPQSCSPLLELEKDKSMLFPDPNWKQQIFPHCCTKGLYLK